MTKRELIARLSEHKWHLSADGSSLLPSALRPHLFMFWSEKNSSKNHLGIFSPDKTTSKIHRGMIFASNAKSKNRKAIFSALATTSIILSGIIVFGTSKPVSAASLTLTIPDNLSLSISPESSSTFKESSPVSLIVKTDAYSGYTLNIKSKDNTNTLKNSSVSGSVLNSITSEMSASTFQSSGTNNTWGFKSSKYKGSSNDNYWPGPTSDVLLEKTSGANNSTGVTYSLGIAAKVDGSLAYGTYKNTFTITATANPVPYTFSYNTNGGGSTPSTQTGTGNEGSTVTLTSSEPSKSGYTFQGWCTVNPGTSESCSGTKYSSGGAYTLTNSSNSVTFYAIWKATGNTMQNWNGCSNLTQDNGSNGNSISITLTDTRDNNKYTVAKLKDGRCWMTQNLKLVGNRTLTSLDSDVSSNFVLPANSGPSGFSAYNTKQVYLSPESTSYNLGAYYTWYTATAGEGTQDRIQQTTQSICPKGWKLPTSNELQQIVDNYTKEAVRQPPANFTIPGYYSNGVWYGAINNTSLCSGLGCNSNYWSSETAGPLSVKVLHICPCSSYVVTGSDSNQYFKYEGHAVRCIHRD